MKILAIETSFDETAIAIADFSGTRENPKLKILSNIVSSQVKLHAEYGGVVPHLAKLEHQKNLTFILLRALKKGSFPISKSKISQQTSKLRQTEKILEREPELLKKFKKEILPIKPPVIDAIAVTHGPGLAPALWVGVNFARALSFLWRKPLIPVSHMAGHLYSSTLAADNTLEKLQFPALALLVSGGHTELVLARGHGKFKIVGETLDDAAGEAFDKVARILGLGYPGGPAISATAEMSFKQFKRLNLRLPRPMINSGDFNFSFSGLKTAVLYAWRDMPHTKETKIALAKEFQNAAVDVLVKKTIAAAKKYKIKTILLGGGVAANKLLRERLSRDAGKELPHVACHMSHVALTGDNALMIALAAFFLAPTPKLLKLRKNNWKRVKANANLRLGK